MKLASRSVTIPLGDPTPQVRRHPLVDTVGYDELWRDRLPSNRRFGDQALDDLDGRKAVLVVNPTEAVEGDFISVRVPQRDGDACKLRPMLLPRRASEEAAPILLRVDPSGAPCESFPASATTIASRACASPRTSP